MIALSALSWSGVLSSDKCSARASVSNASSATQARPVFSGALPRPQAKYSSHASALSPILDCCMAPNVTCMCQAGGASSPALGDGRAKRFVSRSSPPWPSAAFLRAMASTPSMALPRCVRVFSKPCRGWASSWQRYAGCTPYLSHARVLISLCALNAAADTRARSEYCSALIVPASCHSSSGSIALSCETGLLAVTTTKPIRCVVTWSVGTTACEAQKLMSRLLLNFSSSRVHSRLCAVERESHASANCGGAMHDGLLAFTALCL